MQDGYDHMPETDRYPEVARLLTRRQFLKGAGILAATITGLGSGLAGVLSGCDGDGQVGNTTATVHPEQATTTTSVAPTSTTIVTGPETGRDIRIGLVSAMTGPMALFGKADEWWTRLALDFFSDGLVCGDGKLHRFSFITGDSRSNAEHATMVARRVVVDGRADLILCSGGGDMVSPVVIQAESLECPCLCSFVHWRQFASGSGENSGRPLQWSYAHAIGLEDIAAVYVDLWGRLQTNKKVGFVFADDGGGRMWADAAAGLPPAAAEAGYEAVVPGLYPASTADYGAFISEFIKNGCEICCGAFSTSDFGDFWRQALEQGYRPKIMTVGEGLPFAHALEAVRPQARNFTSELLWQPEWPYRDSITGKTCRELANDYMAATGDHWIAPIAQYARFEWAVDAFKRVGDLDRPRDIVGRLASTKLETCLGLIDFSARVDASLSSNSRRPTDNVYKAPVGGGQWIPGDLFGFEPVLLSAAGSPELPTQALMREMDYNTSTQSPA